MDTRFIEVCIGLTLVFALAGMMVTTLLELWLSYRGRRGDNLILAVRSLLADDPHRGGLIGAFSKRRAPSDFTQALLGHPLVVSQSQGLGGEQRKPSYLPGELLIAALLDQLSSSHHGGVRPQTPQLFVNGLRTALRPDGAQPPVELVRSLETLAHGVDGDWPAYERRLVAWFDSVATRSAGWFKRWNQLRMFAIGTLVAAAFNINPLVIAQRLWDEEPLRRAMLTAAEAAHAARSETPASAPVGEAELRASRAAFAALPSGAGKDRAAASSQQGARAFEVDATLGQLEASIGALTSSPRAADLAGEGGQRLEELLRKSIETKELVRTRRISIADHDAPERMLQLSSLIDERLQRMAELAMQGRLDALARHAEAARSALLAERTALALQALPDGQASRCLQASNADARALCEQIEGLRSISGGGGLPVGWSWENIPGCEDGACVDRPLSHRTPQQARSELRLVFERERPGPLPECRDAGKTKAGANDCEGARARAAQQREASEQKLLAAWHQLAEQLRSPRVNSMRVLQKCVQGEVPCEWVWMLLGWLIVGLSAVLGAPFWFDLLGRLINLRGSGAKPAEEGKGGAEGAAAGDGKAGGMLASPSTPPGGPSGGTGAASQALSDAEAQLTAEQIGSIQQRGLQMPAEQVSRRLDTPTRKAIAAFQQHEGYSLQDGVLTGPQIERLLRGTAAPSQPSARPPVPPLALGATPVRTDGSIAPLSEQEIRDIYGDISTRPDTGRAEAGFVIVDGEGKPGGPQRSIVTLQASEFDEPARTALQRVLGRGIEVHLLAKPHFKAVFQQIHDAGCLDDIKTMDGTLVCRHIGLDPSKRLSSHTWGIAIDLNAAQNPRGAQPPIHPADGALDRIVPVFRQHGFAWGGDFKNCPLDGMHFELALRKP